MAEAPKSAVSTARKATNPRLQRQMCHPAESPICPTFRHRSIDALRAAKLMEDRRPRGGAHGQHERGDWGGPASMAILELTNISKHFGAIHALDDVSLDLDPGRVIGRMGYNDAGKSTLVKVIAGNYRPTYGSMRMEGVELIMHKPIEARQHGIEIVYQDLALCDNLTAAANVFLGREIRRQIGPLRILDYAAMYRRAGQ